MRWCWSGRVGCSMVVDALLGVLATAGVGPSMPLAVLHRSLEVQQAAVSRRELEQMIGSTVLYPLLERSEPGLAGDRVGLFHQTLVDHVRAITDVRAANAAVVAAL